MNEVGVPATCAQLLLCDDTSIKEKKAKTTETNLGRSIYACWLGAAHAKAGERGDIKGGRLLFYTAEKITGAVESTRDHKTRPLASSTAVPNEP